jgi:Ulp1 family protease
MWKAWILNEAKLDDGKRKSRGHFLTIREEDLSRLSPGEFLNDTLVDFWMQW